MPSARRPASVGCDDLLEDALLDRRRDERGRRVGAHAARVLAAVAVEGALVVLRGGERHHVLAVADRVVRGLLADQHVLDDDALAGRAEAAPPIISSSAASASAASAQTATPFPAASPSAFTTQRPPRAATARLARLRDRSTRRSAGAGSGGAP